MLKMSSGNQMVRIFCGFVIIIFGMRIGGQSTTDESIDSQLDRMENLLQKISHEMNSRICEQRPRDCADIMKPNELKSGVYAVHIDDSTGPVRVYCDMETEGGGWLVFQRRQDGSVDFYRNWMEYEKGFGCVEGEFWLGNENIHWLTNNGKKYRLRIDLGDFNGKKRYAEYDNFQVGSSCEKYRLISAANYSGTAGHSLERQIGHKFSTYDQDNDTSNETSCAESYRGAWWYASCHDSNLNGAYLGGKHASYADGVIWGTFRGAYYSLRFSEMKIRPMDF